MVKESIANSKEKASIFETTMGLLFVKINFQNVFLLFKKNKIFILPSATQYKDIFEKKKKTFKVEYQV